tara:strand:- start:435 stop:896 length:462 start_codon:yes stop_codon:yes gene_type:complete
MNNVIHSNKLFTAVYEQLGADSIEEFVQICGDIYRNGASAGFSGFIYYQETRDFAHKNQKIIEEALVECANEMGMSPSELIKTCNWIKDYLTEFTTQEFESIFWRIFYAQPFGDDDSDYFNLETRVLNQISWWALEHVAFRITCEAEYQAENN